MLGPTTTHPGGRTPFVTTPRVPRLWRFHHTIPAIDRNQQTISNLKSSPRDIKKTRTLQMNDFQCPNAITLFRFITMVCGTDNILQNILHIQFECGEYFAKYCQSHITLVQIWMMSWLFTQKKSCYKAHKITSIWMDTWILHIDMILNYPWFRFRFIFMNNSYQDIV